MVVGAGLSPSMREVAGPAPSRANTPARAFSIAFLATTCPRGGERIGRPDGQSQRLPVSRPFHDRRSTMHVWKFPFRACEYMVEFQDIAAVRSGGSLKSNSSGTLGGDAER